MTNVPVNPDIKEYSNYRVFLKDFFENKKEMNDSYSFRVFSRHAGISSPSHLHTIIEGKRNLTADTIKKYQKALNFKSNKEKKCFELLVQYNQEKNHNDKVRLFNDLIKERGRRTASTVEKDQFDFLTNWYHFAIYVLIDLTEFKPDLDWIVYKLKGRVSKTDIKKSFNLLLKLNLIRRDEERGFVQTNGSLKATTEVQSLSFQKYHRNAINLSLLSLEEDHIDSREFNGVTIPIKRSNLPLIKEKIRQFRSEINELASSTTDADEVYQMNINLFPLTRPEQ